MLYAEALKLAHAKPHLRKALLPALRSQPLLRVAASTQEAAVQLVVLLKKSPLIRDAVRTDLVLAGVPEAEAREAVSFSGPFKEHAIIAAVHEKVRTQSAWREKLFDLLGKLYKAVTLLLWVPIILSPILLVKVLGRKGILFLARFLFKALLGLVEKARQKLKKKPPTEEPATPFFTRRQPRRAAMVSLERLQFKAMKAEAF